jgi:uncharacterized protein YfiM (DUF2279 family)
MRSLILAALLALPMASQADEWTGRDKQIHFVAGAVVAGSVHELTGSRALGFAMGSLVAISKELADSRMKGHTASYKDAIVTVMGASLVAVPGLRIGPGWVSYRVEF